MRIKSVFHNFLAIVIIMTIASCRNNTIDIPIPNIACNDSTLLKISDTISLNVGNELNPIPFVSQLYISSNSMEIYIAKDEKWLYFYDILGDSLLSKISLSNTHTLHAFSGFVHLGDSTLVYSYPTQELFMLNNNFETIWKRAVDNDCANLINLEALSASPLLFLQGHIVLSGTPKRNPYKYDTYPVSVSCDLRTGEMAVGGNRPNYYRQNDVGGDYMWRVFHARGVGDKLVYSFPLSPYIEIYSKELVKESEFCMASRYSSLPREKDSFLKSSLEGSDEKAYYLSLDTYGSVIYDELRKVYYRIATHPKEKYREGEMSLKPFSIIVADCEGKILSETPVYYHKNTMYYDKIYISSQGLLMQIRSDNENEMKFAVFTLENEKDN